MMRRVALGLVLLLVGPLLSGCIFIFDDDPGDPLAALDPSWVLPRPLDAFPPHGAYGVWVPENATGFRATWPGNGTTGAGNGSATSSGPEAGLRMDGPRNVLGHFPDLLVVIGPDGDRYQVASGRAPIAMGPGAGPEPGAAAARVETPPGVLFHEASPRPGLYRFVVFGAQPLPMVEILVDDDTRIAALSPLPLLVSRTLLQAPAGPDDGMLGSSGSWTPPVGTVAAWGALHGVGFQGRLTLHNSEGEVVADHRRSAMADPTTGNLHEFSLRFQGDFLHRDLIAPDTLDDRGLSWTTTGTGRAVVYAFAAIAATMPAPWVGPPIPPPEGGVEEVTPLENPLEPRQGGALILPESARIRIALDASSGDHARYRMYDADGRRLAWGTVDEGGATVPLPGGALAIVNDGPGRIEVQVVGPAPGDAVLHRMETQRHSIDATLGTAAGGPETTRLRAVFPGPVLGIGTYETGTAEDLEAAIYRDDGGLVSTLPDRAAHDPRSTTCCSPPLFAGYVGDPHWLDPGGHRVHLTAVGGQSEVTLDLYTLDLGLLDSLVQDGK